MEAPDDSTDAGDTRDTDTVRTPPGEPDTDSVEDVSPDTSTPPSDASAEDTSSGDTSPVDTSPVDTSPPEPDTFVEDTGPTDPPDPDECGGNYWDDHHDGSNPWEDFAIDCDELAASWNCQNREAEEYILERINLARQEENLCGTTPYGPSQPLEMDPQLRCAARIHSWDMAGRNYYSHQTPEGLSPTGRVSIVPGPNRTAAENIYQWLTSPENIFQGWMNSPGHCRNMLCGSYSRVGIGIYADHHTLKIIGPGICW
ncbi:MAG: CAP domain-containing protein [Bradymonadaceae bacterium]